MNWLQIRLFGPYSSTFSTNSYGYYSQMSQNLVSNTQIFASALIVRRAAKDFIWKKRKRVYHIHVYAKNQIVFRRQTDVDIGWKRDDLW